MRVLTVLLDQLDTLIIYILQGLIGSIAIFISYFCVCLFKLIKYRLRETRDHESKYYEK
jgi:hypothetical protein